MRVSTLIAATAGTALAAPYSSHRAFHHKRQAPANVFTTLDCGGGKLVVDEMNMLNGTYTNDETEIIKPKAITKPSPSAENRPMPGNLPLRLINNLGGENLKTYISGLDSDGSIVFIGAGGILIYPSSGESGTPIPVTEEIGIPMPPLGETLEITLPIVLESGRIYFADGDLAFSIVFTGNGDGLVQPSISDMNDPSRCINWGFVELTLTDEGVIWANISYVDFIGMIMAMTLDNQDGTIQEVIGLPADGVAKVCEELLAQGEADGIPWGASCLAKPDGTLLRALSPEDLETIAPGGFDNYYTAYIDEVWETYKTKTLTFNTQNENGDVACTVQDDLLVCEGDNRGYPKPDVHDIWGCNSGPFGILEGDNAIHYAIVPRLCAAFTRSSLLIDGGDYQPGPLPSQYYTVDPTSHYSRIIHANEVDGKGYAFAYDDVNPPEAGDAAGLIASGQPAALTFHVGGKA